jgi:hypothetical protein
MVCRLSRRVEVMWCVSFLSPQQPSTIDTEPFVFCFIALVYVSSPSPTYPSIAPPNTPFPPSLALSNVAPPDGAVCREPHATVRRVPSCRSDPMLLYSQDDGACAGTAPLEALLTAVAVVHLVPPRTLRPRGEELCRLSAPRACTTSYAFTSLLALVSLSNVHDCAYRTFVLSLTPFLRAL